MEKQRGHLRRVSGRLPQTIKDQKFQPRGQSTPSRPRDMTCFQVGKSGKGSSAAGGSRQQPQPFVEFSPHQDRASLMSSVGSGSLGSTRRKRKTSTRRASGKRRVSRVRVIKDRVSLRVGGFPGVQHVGASQLVRFVPLTKLKAAAKRVLGGSAGASRRRHRRRRKATGKRRRRKIGVRRRRR